MAEYHAYDELLGRRIATWRCEAVDSTVIDWGPTGVCKAKSVMHDYYGLSQRVAATRLSPWRYNGLSYDNVGDEFHESYTYGPVGVTARTVETEDTDPEDNFDHWVLPDLFGGTSALLLYDAEPHERALATEHFDAFGVRVAKGSGWGLNLDASRYRWRSQEGSETDDLHRDDPDEDAHLSPPSLVYMQTRHYDPALGRFIMADSIPMGAFSPQGLNRYAYCTNDPVGMSDPSGMFGSAIALLAGMYSGFIGGEIQGLFGGMLEHFNIQALLLLGNLGSLMGGGGCTIGFNAGVILGNLLMGELTPSKLVNLYGFIMTLVGRAKGIISAFNPVVAARLGYVIGFILGWLSFASAADSNHASERSPNYHNDKLPTVAAGRFSFTVSGGRLDLMKPMGGMTADDFAAKDRVTISDFRV